MKDVRIVLVTAPRAQLAEKLAKGLVKKKLAACVSEVPGLKSHYFWEGRLQKDRETLLVIKTRSANIGRIIDFIKKNHGAQLPEIISLPVAGGDPRYLEWLASNCR